MSDQITIADIGRLGSTISFLAQQVDQLTLENRKLQETLQKLQVEKEAKEKAVEANKGAANDGKLIPVAPKKK